MSKDNWQELIDLGILSRDLKNATPHNQDMIADVLLERLERLDDEDKPAKDSSKG